MARVIEDGDLIRLAKFDVRVLLALLKGKMSKYDIGRQCELDLGDGRPVRNNELYASIKSLDASGYIKAVGVSGPRQAHIYQITRMGRTVLGLEIGRMERLTKLARARLKS